MVANLEKFQGILCDKRKLYITNKNIKVGNQNIQEVSDLKMLGVHVDRKLKFNLHIDKICRSASNQLNALTKRKKYLVMNKGKVLVDSFNFKLLSSYLDVLQH